MALEGWQGWQWAGLCCVAVVAGVGGLWEHPVARGWGGVVGVGLGQHQERLRWERRPAVGTDLVSEAILASGWHSAGAPSWSGGAWGTWSTAEWMDGLDWSS